MCAWLKQLPTGWRGRNKEERHRKLLICAPDCQSATGALHYRHEERSSAFSNPSVLFNYTRAPRTNTHTWDRACAQLHGDKEEMQISLSSLAHQLQLCIKEKRKWISLTGMRRKAAGVEGSRLTLSPRLPSQHASFSCISTLTHNKSKHLYQQPPSPFFVLECLHSPVR